MNARRIKGKEEFCRLFRRVEVGKKKRKKRNNKISEASIKLYGDGFTLKNIKGERSFRLWMLLLNF